MGQNSRITKVILPAILVSGVLLIIPLYVLHCYFFPPPENNYAVKVQYLEQYVKVFQILVVGVVATLISVIIPRLVPESRDLFERYKESRQAYSRAKTAVLYLPDRVVNAADMKEAFELMEEAHRELHFAETFEKVIIAKGYLAWFANPHLWILYNYWQIYAIAEVVRRTKWGAVTKKDMRTRIEDTLEEVHDFFGENRRGENVADQNWVIDKNLFKRRKKVKRFAVEGELKKIIDEKLKSLTG